MKNEEIITQVLKLLKQRELVGEAYLSNNKKSAVKVRNQKLERYENKEIKGLGIRVLRNQVIGLASTTDLSREGILKTLEKALASCDYLTSDPYNDFVAKIETLSQIKIFDSAIEKISLAEKVRIAQRLEETAKDIDSGIKLWTAQYSDTISETFIANTYGLNCQSISGLATASIDLVAEKDGEAENTWGTVFARNLQELKPEWLAKTMAEKAVRMLGAKKYSTRKTNIVLDPEMTFALFCALSPLFNAKNVLEGKSLFANKMGEKIASEKVTLIDNGILEDGAGSSLFDAEGIPCQKTILIEKGVLQGFLHQLKTAKQMGVRPTGNADRTYNAQPRISPTNLCLEPGKISQKELISQVQDGIIVYRLMNLHSVDPISGNFSLGANGRIIEKGQLSYPVKEFTIAENIVDFLNKIVLVANDSQLFLLEELFSGGTGIGTSILVKDISVAGE